MTTDTRPDKRKRKLFSLLLPMVIITSVLGYFHLFYKSSRVDNQLVETTHILKHEAQVRTVHFSPNDSLLASGSVDKTVRIWNTANGALMQTLHHPEGITYLDYTPDGKTIVTSSYDGIIRAWDLQSGKIIKEFKPNTGVVWTIAISPDGRQLASSGEGKTIDIWDMQTGTILNKLKGHTRNVWSVRFSDDGTLLSSGSFDATVKIWNVSDGKLLKNITDHTEAVVDLNFSHDGRLLATTSDDKTIRVWNIPEVNQVRSLKVPEHIQAAAFSPDDKWLLTGGRDKPMIGEFLQEIFGNSKINPGVSLRLWDPSTGKLMQTIDDHYNDVNDVAWSHNGKFFASASEDTTVRIYKLKVEQSNVSKKSYKSNESGAKRHCERVIATASVTKQEASAAGERLVVTKERSNGPAESMLFVNSMFLQ